MIRHVIHDYAGQKGRDEVSFRDCTPEQFGRDLSRAGYTGSVCGIVERLNAGESVLIHHFRITLSVE